MLTVVQKRKAQNRAAQRAFRERKEKHLKDLETKVGELEKASESANHENGLLRAQVDRLQIELREYRKRLSLNGTSNLGRSPPASNSSNGLSFLASSANGNDSNNFQFEFPRFGKLPNSVFNNGLSAKPISPPASSGVPSPASNSAPGILARNDSTARSISPRSQARANGSLSSVGTAQVNGSMSSSITGNSSTPVTNDNLAALFSPSLLGNNDALNFTSYLPNTTAEPQNMSGDNQSSSGQSRIFQFNSNSVSSDSPGSSSSVSQYGGANSSCGTSPEPSHNSPSSGNKDATLDTINESNGEGEMTFCDKLNMACGNIRDPIPRTKSQSNGTSGAQVVDTITATVNTDNNNLKDFDWFANQNGGQFDPVLFGDYREPQNAIVGDGDFTGGFFNDAMPTMDFSSPFNWADLTAPTGLTPAIQKSNPLEQADALQAGLDEEVVPGDNPNSLLSCHKIWYAISIFSQFQASTNIASGTNYKTAKTSKMEASTLTVYVRNSEPRRAVPRQALLSIRKMSTVH
jgi:AP-1-like factor